MSTQASIVQSGLVKLVSASSVNDTNFDGVLVISESLNTLSKYPALKDLHQPIENYSKLHQNFEGGQVSLIPHDAVHSKRVIYSSTGSVTGDFDDVRKFKNAGVAAAKSALSAGIKTPLVVLPPSEHFSNAQLLSLIGVLHGFYVPLNVREAESKKSLIKLANAFQSAFLVCRDVGDSDPVRMAPPRVAEYIQELFKNSAVKVRIESDQEVIRKEYPLVHAVNRSSCDVEAYKARLIWLEYVNEETLRSKEDFETLMMVGKGVTLDTGGTDVKVGGAMFGMSRDKYGSAVVAGFFQALNVLRPKGIKVVAYMCMVRNSVGSNSYTCDEIITSRSGKRIHIYNTDAEGRIAMLEPLTEMRELAMKEKNPHLMTLATLTGHCVLTYGYFSAIMDNGPAKDAHYAEQLQKSGDAYGQPVEISRLKSEDFAFHAAECSAADLRQANTKPSVQTLRGHMTPAAFLMSGSRLDENGLNSPHPLKYTHVDIGSSMGSYPDTTFPAPLLALIAHHILPRVD
ncbi:cytosol aminopeptidase family, catalytic domain-containing protein [Ditylenchus destructor]|uniref:Cytosol aminopeptidase family, catalytic domain-containing protein n=1 Tax=Ditylenchus destructor TaxID=166010 RepID=A0AAD4RAI9_9BILA|nr:cytosol aminopeptidase family, catalytic domain-containing protein [Ditylenchus destructor]